MPVSVIAMENPYLSANPIEAKKVDAAIEPALDSTASRLTDCARR